MPGYAGASGWVTGRMTGAGTTQDGSITGHPTRFLSYSHYFLNQGGGTTAVTPLAGAAQPVLGPTYAGAVAGVPPTRPASPGRRR